MDNIPYRLFFRAIANPTRMEIIRLLRKKPCNVTEICNSLGFEQSRVSHNLKCLVDCGFLSARWKKGMRVYSLNGNVRPILNSIDKHIISYHNELIKCGILKGGKT